MRLGAQLAYRILDRLGLICMLRILNAGIVISQQRATKQEEMRCGIVSLDVLNELHHARGEDAVAQRFAEV